MLHILRAPLIYHPFFFVSRYFATFFLFLFFFLPHSPSSWFNHNLLSSFLRFSYYMISLFFSSLHVIRLYLHPIFSSPPSPFFLHLLQPSSHFCLHFPSFLFSSILSLPVFLSVLLFTSLHSFPLLPRTPIPSSPAYLPSSSPFFFSSFFLFFPFSSLSHPPLTTLPLPPTPGMPCDPNEKQRPAGTVPVMRAAHRLLFGVIAF